MAGDTFLGGHAEVVSFLSVDGLPDVGMAREASGAGDDLRSFMALRAVVHATQMFMSG